MSVLFVGDFAVKWPTVVQKCCQVFHVREGCEVPGGGNVGVR